MMIQSELDTCLNKMVPFSSEKMTFADVDASCEEETADVLFLLFIGL